MSRHVHYVRSGALRMEGSAHGSSQCRTRSAAMPTGKGVWCSCSWKISSKSWTDGMTDGARTSEYVHAEPAGELRRCSVPGRAIQMLRQPSNVIGVCVSIQTTIFDEFDRRHCPAEPVTTQHLHPSRNTLPGTCSSPI